MTDSIFSSVPMRTTVAIAALTMGSVLFSKGFTCAVPVAAFAAIASLSFGRRTALLATALVWFVNQVIGFAFMHYPTDPATLAWGGALGAIALLTCMTAGYCSRRLPGHAGACVVLLAAFFTYEMSLRAIDAALGTAALHVGLSNLARIASLNALAFGGFWVLKLIAMSTVWGRRLFRGPNNHLAAWVRSGP